MKKIFRIAIFVGGVIVALRRFMPDEQRVQLGAKLSQMQGDKIREMMERMPDE